MARLYDLIRRYGRNAADEVFPMLEGAVEVPAALVSGMLADTLTAAPNLAVAAGALSPETADAVNRRVMDRFTYQPRTAGGREGMEGLSRNMALASGVSRAAYPGIYEVGRRADDAVDVPERGERLGAGLLSLSNVVDPGMAAGALGIKAAMIPGKAVVRDSVTGIVDPLPGHTPVTHATLRPPTPAAARSHPVEGDPIEALFGRKQAEEARIAEAVDALDELDAPEPLAPRTRGEIAAVPPDIYRVMQQTQGTDAVLDAARRGDHLRRSAAGGYVGTPRHIQDMAGVEELRKGLDDQLSFSAEAIAAAEMGAGTPERIGTWYPRAREFNWMINEPQQLDQWLNGVRVYSAGVSPESELAFNLKHWNSRALGNPQMAYRGAAERKLDGWEAGTPTTFGYKIDEYGKKNDPRINSSSPFGVNDFRMAQSFGYTDPEGNPWRAGVSATMHPFMDAETALLADRANRNAVGGITNWTGETVQEVPWIGGKAQDLYARGAGAKYAGEDGKARALRDANNTAADYAPKHTLSATYETTPGAGTGHRADLLDAPYEARQQYQRAAGWTRPEDQKDILYSAVGLRQLPAIESVGSYTNSLGGVEANPLTIARPLMDFRTVPPGSKIPPSSISSTTQKAVEAVEGFRGLINAQEAAAANLPVTVPSRKGKYDLLLDTSNGSPMGGRQLTPAQMIGLQRVLAGSNVSPTSTSRGVALLNFAEADKAAINEAKRKAVERLDSRRAFESSFVGPRRTPYLEPSANRIKQENAAARKSAADRVQSNVQRAAQRDARERLGALQDLPEGMQIMPAAREGAYIPTLGPEQGTGMYTAAAIERLAQMPDKAFLNLAEDEGVRARIRQIAQLDAGHPLAREDLQRTRQFFSDEAWQQLLPYLRKGMTVGAAMSALGWSLQGMAAEDEAMRK